MELFEYCFEFCESLGLNLGKKFRSVFLSRERGINLAVQKLRALHEERAVLQKQKEYSELMKTRYTQNFKAFTYEAMEEKARYLKIGDRYLRLYYLAGLPAFISAANLFPLVNLPIPLYFSYHIKGTHKGAMLKAARQRYSVLESSQNGRLEKGKRADPEHTKEMQELNCFITDLVNEQEKAFLTSVYVALSAESEQRLLKAATQFQDTAQDSELTFNTYTFAQRKAFQSILPLGEDTVREQHLMQTSAVINLLPFLTRNFNDPEGVFLGTEHFNNSLLILDLFKARNANLNIFGTSGSGKSVTAKLIMARLAMRGVQNIVLDPEGEYSELTKALGGQVYYFSSQTGLDPFRMFEGTTLDQTTKVQILKHFFGFFIQAKHVDRSRLDSLLYSILNRSNPAKMQDFLALLEEEMPDSGLLRDIAQLVNGSLGGLFSNESQTFDLDASCICFDLSAISSVEQKVPLMYLLANCINSIINKKDRQRLIYIDEAHKLLHDSTTAAFYIDLVKTARKRKAGVVTITQNPEDFKESDGARTIITQAETTILLKQAPASVNFIKRYGLFKLNEQECAEIMGFNIGSALLIREREHVFMDIFPFNSEREIIFT